MPRKSTKAGPPAKASDIDMMVMDEDFAASGLGAASAEDIPRLALLQKLSPQLDKALGDYIPDAQEGQVCAIGADYVADSIEFLACQYVKVWLEWQEPRGSGAPTIHTTSKAFDAARQNADAWPPRLPNGNLIQEVSQFTGLVVEPTGVIWPARLPMASTQLKRARKWLMVAHRNRIKTAEGKIMPAPLWSQSFTLSSAVERNDQGSWHSWVITPARRLDAMCETLGLDLQACMKQCRDIAESAINVSVDAGAEEEAF